MRVKGALLLNDTINAQKYFEKIDKLDIYAKKRNLDVDGYAFLLGENASYTEAMLNSIVESHKDSGQKDNEPLTFEL